MTDVNEAVDVRTAEQRANSSCNTLLCRARHLANQLEQSAAVIRELCDALDLAGSKLPEPGILSMSVDDLDLYVRGRKCLRRLGITTVGQLVQKSGKELLKVKNLGITSLNQIREHLADVGLKLRDD